MLPSSNDTEQPARIDSATMGLRKLLRQGTVSPASVLACPSLISLAPSVADEALDDGVAATMIARAVEQAIKQAPEHKALAVLFGVNESTARRPLGVRRTAAAEIVGVTVESFRVRREPRLVEKLARTLLVELPYLSAEQHGSTSVARDRAVDQAGGSTAAGSDASDSAISAGHSRRDRARDLTTRRLVADRLWDVTNNLRKAESTLGMGILEMQTAARLGEVMGAIKGTGGQPKRIQDGYQYVGNFPAHLWRLATADVHYRTLTYGIATFHKRWGMMRQELTTPYHYVSIGPGTGEKDQTILRHLQSLAGDETIAYVPVDISPQLLRTSLSISMRDVDHRLVEVIPVELDVTNDDALEGLRLVIDAIRGERPILLSLLGNTLANFGDDKNVLERLASLISDRSDRFLLELATTQEATSQTAELAASEYEGSPSFTRFAMAALEEYTDLRRDLGSVHPTAQIIDGAIKVTTRFHAAKRLTVGLKDGDSFTMRDDDEIELYTSRKYTDAALGVLLSDFETISESGNPYPSAAGLGLVAMLLRTQG
jgi:L-histidine N-alpha-methyltransferase